MTIQKFGWTVIRRDEAKGGFFVYKRDSEPPDDLVPFTFASKSEATAQGEQGIFAYKST